MASTKSPNDPSLGEKIDGALSLWTVDGNSLSQSGSSEDGFMCISSKFPYNHLIRKCRTLEEDKLFEAIIFARIVDNPDEAFYPEELVWVEGGNTCPQKPKQFWLYRDCGKRILYSIEANNLLEIREGVQKTRAFLEEKVKKNLTEAFSTRQSHISRTGPNSTSQSSHDAQVCNSSSSSNDKVVVCSEEDLLRPVVKLVRCDESDESEEEEEISAVESDESEEEEEISAVESDEEEEEEEISAVESDEEEEEEEISAVESKKRTAEKPKEKNMREAKQLRRSDSVSEVGGPVKGADTEHVDLSVITEMAERFSEIYNSAEFSYDENLRRAFSAFLSKLRDEIPHLVKRAERIELKAEYIKQTAEDLLEHIDFISDHIN